jgi:hypothetical protein
MCAVQLADQLHENPALNLAGPFDRWEHAWLTAHLTLYKIRPGL